MMTNLERDLIFKISDGKENLLGLCHQIYQFNDRVLIYKRLVDLNLIGQNLLEFFISECESSVLKMINKLFNIKMRKENLWLT